MISSDCQLNRIGSLKGIKHIFPNDLSLLYLQYMLNDHEDTQVHIDLINGYKTDLS